MEWIVQMGFELAIYQVDELAGMYWYADLGPLHRPYVSAEAIAFRYLQHLASTRLHHIERIRTFSMHRLKRIAKPTLKQKTSFRRSFSFLDFAALEASATQSFAEGLSCVSPTPRPLSLQILPTCSLQWHQLFSFLAHLGLIPAPYHPLPYSMPALRYSLRMRPFLSVSLPEVLSYPEFSSRVSLQISERVVRDPSHQTDSRRNQIKNQASSILDFADQALKAARKDWEAISKARVEIAQCVGCDDWWRSSVKNILRACIMANITIATSKKAMSNAASGDLRDILKLELAKSNELYHAWWIVPRILAK